MSVTVVDHALAGHLLAQLRAEDTAPPVFRTLAKRLALTLALEAIRDLPTTEITVPGAGSLIAPAYVPRQPETTCPVMLQDLPMRSEENVPG